jgi:hypothetical protein
MKFKHYIKLLITLFLVLIILITLKDPTWLILRERFQNNPPAEFGIIITRHIRKHEQNRIYEECKSILVEIPMENTRIIQSEYPASGELLPYYYMLKEKLLLKALVLHDSMFLNTMINKDDIDSYKFLYEFNPNEYSHSNDNIEKMLDATKKPSELKEFLKTDTWKGCFGTCSVITLSFLEKLDGELGLSNLVSVIKNREDRMGLERVFGVMCMYMEPKEVPSLFGMLKDMKAYPKFNEYSFDNYLIYKYDDAIRKVWNGR